MKRLVYLSLIVLFSNSLFAMPYNNILFSAFHKENKEFEKKEQKNSDLHYFKARYYNADVGRFLSPDPHTLNPRSLELNDPQTLNPYVYCTNNPNKYVDPNGLWRTYVNSGGAAYITREPVIDATSRSLSEFGPGVKLADTYMRKVSGDITRSGKDWAFGVIGIIPGGSHIAAKVASTFLSGTSGAGVVSAVETAKHDQMKLGMFTKLTGVEGSQSITGGIVKYNIGNVKKEEDIYGLESYKRMDDIDNFWTDMDKVDWNFDKLNTTLQDYYKNEGIYDAWREVGTENY
jgi:RHS repeat-associated protein